MTITGEPPLAQMVELYYGVVTGELAEVFNREALELHAILNHAEGYCPARDSDGLPCERLAGHAERCLFID